MPNSSEEECMTDFIRALPFDDWPESHRALYQQACAEKTSLFDGRGLASGWAPATHRGVMQRWGLWLDYLMRIGRYDPAERPSQTINFNSLKDYVNDLQARVSSATVATCIRDVSEALRVMEPHADRSLMRQAVSELESEAVPGIDEISAQVGASNIYRAGMARMAKFEHAALSHWRPALAFGDGLMMVTWISKPVRRRTFVSTTTSNLIERGDAIDLRYPASAVKTHVRVAAALPMELTSWIRHWRYLVTTVLNGPDEGALWVTRRGRPFQAAGLPHGSVEPLKKSSTFVSTHNACAVLRPRASCSPRHMHWKLSSTSSITTILRWDARTMCAQVI
jgi:hypothetical protein